MCNTVQLKHTESETEGRKGRDYGALLLRLNRTDRGFVHWQLHSHLHHTGTAREGRRTEKKKE